MTQGSKSINSNTVHNFILINLNNSQIMKKPNEMNKKNIPHDQPGLYQELGIVCFATSTFLLGISS